MTKLCLLTAFLFAFSTSFAQVQKQTDSLLNALDKETVDSNKIKIYNRLGNLYIDNNAGKAIEFFEQVRDLSLKNNLTLKAANSYYDLGFCYLLKADFDKSLYNYQQSSLLYEKLKDKRRLSNAFMSIGNVYFQVKDRKNMDAYYDKSESISTAIKDTQQLCSLYDSRAIVNDQLGNYDAAVFYHTKAIGLAKLMHDEDMLYNSISNIGLTYKHQFKTEEALKNFDSVRVYYEKTDAPKDMVAGLYNNIAATQAQAGDFAAAVASFNKSIALSKAGGTPSIEMENYRNMSDMYSKMKNYELQAVYLTKYYGLKDSLFSADKKNALTELEANFRVEKKNTEIAKKQAEVEHQKGQRNIFIILTIAVLAILTALGFFYSRISRNNKLLQQKNIQISEQKNELQTLNHVKDRLFSIISHDLRNPLVTLRSYLTLADNDSLAAEKKQLFKIQTMNAVSQTGDMLDNLLAWANVQIKDTRPSLIPVNIADLVADTISNVKAQAYQKRIKIEAHIEAEVLPGDYDILSIALRNLLTNAVKYSPENTKITISSVKKEGNIFISVKDEGVGLSQQQIQGILSNQNDTTKGTQGEKGSGLGLFLVRELLQKINAALLIESAPDLGSTFTISAPAM